MSLLAFLAAASAAMQPTPLDRAVERLEPSTVIEGDAVEVMTIEEMMAATDVPAVSIALVDDNRIVALRAYGMADPEREIAADIGTRFQAASLSKSVAAYGAMVMVEQGTLDLDAPINSYLESWQLPQGEYAPATLRTLLSHRAGTSVSGFPGYSLRETVPSTIEVLDGLGNTAPVVIDSAPGEFRYSGGGYTVAQLAMVEQEGQPFEDILARLVLIPLGMDRSSYAQPPRGPASTIAAAHEGDGAPVEGGYHFYPEQAAAGLWTTPGDLALFLIAANQTLAGSEAHPLSPAGMAEMLAAPEEDAGYALGFGIYGEGEDFQFSHGGSNMGYKSLMVSFPERGEAMVIMTNGDRGAEVFQSVATAVAKEMGWNAFEQRRLVPADWGPADMEQVVGGYALGEDIYRFSIVDGELVLTDPDGETGPMIALADDQIYIVEGAQVIDIDRDEDGNVIGVSAGGTKLPKVE
ncbi:serine hydrolase domain-containing protein [Sphingomicrobium sediminis]|uniref:Beta-lactamase family protein n=1 Tax=Sphingomicrobium sediminis TaxID=2950949 RepID=A0A9X2J286_9SPHN|nr:serine hydrolase domain-containing protein [Sphingomicrobium sediminis]MCM8558023.1 beta-lactamase family protein [Sphingomicrobium sediminis]